MHKQNMLFVLRSMIGEGESDEEEEETEVRTPKALIARQVNGNFVVMQTEVLLWQMAYASYLMGDNGSVSAEDQGKAIEDDKYDLLAFVENVETTIQCFVACSNDGADRVVVAFRGTGTCLCHQKTTLTEIYNAQRRGKTSRKTWTTRKSRIDPRI